MKILTCWKLVQLCSGRNELEIAWWKSVISHQSLLVTISKCLTSCSSSDTWRATLIGYLLEDLCSYIIYQYCRKFVCSPVCESCESVVPVVYSELNLFSRFVLCSISAALLQEVRKCLSSETARRWTFVAAIAGLFLSRSRLHWHVAGFLLDIFVSLDDPRLMICYSLASRLTR